MTAKRRKRDPVRRFDRISPTPETAAKLRPDVVWTLFERGFLTAAGEKAARDIRDIYLAVVAELMPSKMRLSSEHSGKFILTDEMAEKYADVYQPWARSIDRQVIDNVVTLVVDGYSKMDEDECGLALAAIEKFGAWGQKRFD